MSLIIKYGESLTREVLAAVPEGLLSSLVAQSLPSTATDTWYGIPSTANSSGGGGGGRFKKGDVVVPKDKQAESDRGYLYEYEKAIVTAGVDSDGDCKLRRVRDGHTFGDKWFKSSQLALAESSSSSSSSSSSVSAVGSLLHLALKHHCQVPVIELLLGLHPNAAKVTDAKGRLPLALAIELKQPSMEVLELLVSLTSDLITAVRVESVSQ